MKKVILFILLTGIMTISVSCDKEEKDSIQTNSLIGTWVITNTIEEKLIDNEIQEEQTSANNGITIEFLADNSFISREDVNDREDGIYSVSENMLTLTLVSEVEGEENYEEIYNFSVNDTTLVLMRTKEQNQTDLKTTTYLSRTE